MLPCHEVLERDELELLRSLGHYVFSPGSFVSPLNRGEDLLRPTIEGLEYDPDDVAMYHALGKDGRDQKGMLSKEFADRFDLVLVHHIPEWVTDNWAQIGHKPVVLRTIGQLIERQERQLAPFREKGLHIVRYSPAEKRIPGYIGADALIRFWKDPDEWTGWNGGIPRVLHLGQDVIKRAKACSYDFYEKVTRPFPRLLIGSGSEVVPWGVGKCAFHDMKEAMRFSRVFFYTGTHPASYTLGFIEAMMLGVPVVSIGNNHGNSPDIPGHKLFEVPEILDGTNGFASDDPFELQDMIQHLLTNKPAADAMSKAGRETAIRLFGKAVIRQQWQDFLTRFE